MKLRTVEKVKTKGAAKMRGKPWWKRRTSKVMRKMAKEEPEDAPRRLPIRGWLD